MNDVDTQIYSFINWEKNSMRSQQRLVGDHHGFLSDPFPLCCFAAGANDKKKVKGRKICDQMNRRHGSVALCYRDSSRWILRSREMYVWNQDAGTNMVGAR